MNEQHNPWKIIAEKNVYNNPWINVTEYDVINPGGGKGIYGKVHFKNIAVGIIPLDDENNTWLVGQYRFPTNKYSWEIPEGGGSSVEATLIAAQRELLEETGLKAAQWDKLLEMHLSNSVTDELSVVYTARGISQHAAQPEETEQLALQKISFTKVVEKVIAGEITDAITVAAILKLNYLIEHKLI